MQAQVPPPQDRADVLILLLFEAPNQPARLAVAYDKVVADAEVKRDFEQLAGELKQPVPKVTIGRPKSKDARDHLSAEATLDGLVNWSSGQLNLNPLINTFRRYGRLRIHFQFFTPFNVTWPREGGEQGPVRWSAKVSGNAAVYDVWVEQGTDGPIDIARSPGLGVRFWLAMAAAALVLGAVVYGVVYLLMGNRRAGSPEREAAGEERS